MGLQNNALPIRNNQTNSGSAVSLLTTAGDLLINNNLGQARRLPIGEENFQLTVDNGQATWKRSTGELFKIGYYSFPEGTYWNSTWGENGVEFNQTNLTKYNHSNKIYANLKQIDSNGSLANKSTSSNGGYTAGNLVLYKSNCQELWCSITTDVANLNNILNNLGTTGSGAIDQIVNFVETDVIFGIDLLIDDPASLSTTGATNLNTWLGDLKTGLNTSSAGASLNITLPAIGNATIASAYNFNYSTFASNVDTITINCCCAMSDFGYGVGNSPLELLVGGSFNDKDMCNTASDEQGKTVFYEGGVLGKYASDNSNNNMEKLVLSLPCDGFVHAHGANAFSITGHVNRNTINLNTTYNTNVMLGNIDSSSELRWFDDAYTYSFTDGNAMRRKSEVIRQWLNKWELDYPEKSKPLYEMMFWAMGGGNPSYFD